MLKFKLIAGAVGAVALFATGAAQATVVLNDNFDAEHGGASDLNYNGFANWNVVYGTVDIVATPDYGITCAGGVGSCVDLDGSTMQSGMIETLHSYAFNAGDTVTFSFDLSGNQRRNNSEDFFAGFDFGSNNTSLVSYSTAGGFGVTTPVTNVFVANIGSGGSIAFGTPFTNYSVSFVAGQSGTVRAYVGSFNSNDNVGPVLDNAQLSVSSAVPEPATWALMIGGFGLMGAALRRRRGLALA
jgi:hypothetical protein